MTKWVMKVTEHVKSDFDRVFVGVGGYGLQSVGDATGCGRLAGNGLRPVVPARSGRPARFPERGSDSRSGRRPKKMPSIAARSTSAMSPPMYGPGPPSQAR